MAGTGGGNLECLHQAARKYGVERILFGSMSPLQCLHSHLMNLPENQKTQILSINPKNFLEETNDPYQ